MNKKKDLNALLDDLKVPERKYRPIPFWSWNEKLNASELRRQIKLMSRSGVGGYFMHARAGLQTDYLGEEWFDSIQAGVEAGAEHGLTPWVYDEEGWPSGFAGGKVTQKGDWTYARGLRMRRIASQEEADKGDGFLGLFACTQNDEEIVPVYMIQTHKTYAGYIEMSHSSSPFYIDVMNHEVIHDFIQETHEQYARRYTLGEDGLLGFFTDEPRFSEGPIPWSYVIPDAFKASYGYDILDKLPALYLPCEGYQKVRHDFWALANDLFVNAFIKQQGDWCEEHNCKLTGHMMMEESLYSQMTGTGGGMPFYEFMQQPGVDSLRRNTGDPRIPKQVGSVAEQLGKEQVLTESYAMSGWDLNFSEMRWIAGWQYINGVNLMCQHLQAYSLKGVRKRDYPPSLYYQQSWYDEYYRFNDYLARLGKLLSNGKKHIDVLMLHPMHSGWISYDGTQNEEISRLDRDFAEATEFLSGAHIDYHLGDETILRRHGKALPDGRIQVGNYAYGAVVVPSCLTMDAHTLQLLEAFTGAGHPLVQLGSWPSLCEGEKSERVVALQNKAVAVSTDKELHTLLAPVLEQPIHLYKGDTECSAIHCCQVSLAVGGTAIVLVNMDRTQEHETVLALGGSNIVYSLALDTLETEELETIYRDEQTNVNLKFTPMETKVLFYQKGVAQNTKLGKELVISLADVQWDIEEIEDNILTLDSCAYTVNGSEWQEPKAVIHLMEDLLDLQRECDIRQKFTFTVQSNPKDMKRLCLVMEQPHQFTVKVNEHIVQFAPPSPVFNKSIHYKDLSFVKADILAYVQQGENIIEMSSRFYQRQHVYDVLYGKNVYETELNKLTYGMELESIYLLGDFGVYSQSEYTAGPRNSLSTAGPFVLDTMPKRFEKGNFTTQGLAFFAGKLTVSHMVAVPENTERVLLRLEPKRIPMLQLYIHDEPVKIFLWGPYVQDITAYVKPGVNKISLQIYASNRNMLGPHHDVRKENYSVGPLSFTGRFSWADRESEAVTITREMRLQNFWDAEYSFVEFGL